jgi:hypothetical protein
MDEQTQELLDSNSMHGTTYQMMNLNLESTRIFSEEAYTQNNSWRRSIPSLNERLMGKAEFVVSPRQQYTNNNNSAEFVVSPRQQTTAPRILSPRSPRYELIVSPRIESANSNNSSTTSSGYDTPNTPSPRINHQVFTLCMLQAFPDIRVTEITEMELLDRVTMLHNLILQEFGIEKSEPLLNHTLAQTSKQYNEVMKSILQFTPQLAHLASHTVMSETQVELLRQYQNLANTKEMELREFLVASQKNAIFQYQRMMNDKITMALGDTGASLEEELIINVKVKSDSQTGGVKKKKKKDKKDVKKSRALPAIAGPILLVSFITSLTTVRNGMKLIMKTHIPMQKRRNV